MQPCFIRSFHARHLLFNLKQETGREFPPSAPLVFRKQETKVGSMTPPVLLKSIRDFGIEGESFTDQG